MQPTRPRPARLALLLALDAFHGVASGDWLGVEIWVLILFAEYAATIRTIPPKEERKASRASSASEAAGRVEG